MPKISNSLVLVLTMAALTGFPCLNILGKIFFLNRTASMPTGIYVISSANKLEIGDIVVFYLNDKSGNLIKYAAGLPGDEFCLDFENTLWINNQPLAQKNIQKYPEQSLEFSSCQTLKKGELLVLGDHPDSYDSRYFGPIKYSRVLAQVELLLKL
jgi:conjugal transfer pilin signal peptidase TrbI